MIETIGKNAKLKIVLGDKEVLDDTIVTEDMDAVVIAENGTQTAKYDILIQKDTEKIILSVTGYDGSDTTINIPEKIGKTTVVKIGESAFYKNNIAEVTIPSSVVELGDYSFRESFIEKLTFEPGIDIKTIGDTAFAGNPLESVSINKYTTYYKDILPSFGGFSDANIEKRDK